MRGLCSQVPCTGLRSFLKTHRLLTAFPDTAQCLQRQSLGQGNSSAKDADAFSESYKNRSLFCLRNWNNLDLSSGPRKTELTFRNLGCIAKKYWGFSQGCNEPHSLLGRWIFGSNWHHPTGTRNRNSCLVSAVKTSASHLLALGPWAKIQVQLSRAT